MVLSEPYAAAMHDELRAAGQRGDDVLLIGGERDIPGIHRVPANGALRGALGGTLTSLNVRMAASWLKHWRTGRPLVSAETAASWKRWAAAAEHHERYQRTPMTDEEIREFIRTESARNPGYSRTRLHRLLRESGRACEQKRFALLYAATMEE
ncbi:hypothetical protein [Thermobifida halotolerans]|uniref:hypothetical protein n=1 Tax=Thermobifida halotolerans TaxID=483545 RepID=UPI001B875522|nr:hypothetical protein [Thermobifida halotolerans]